MKLTTKGRYAVTAMLDVALHQGEDPVSLADIAGRQGLSLSYLEQLFAQLRREGLVESTRGPGGGYKLSRVPEQISVAQVIAAVDESVDVTLCRGRANCNQNSRCLTHDLWTELSAKLYEFLDHRSLADVLARRMHAPTAAERALRPAGPPSACHHRAAGVDVVTFSRHPAATAESAVRVETPLG